MSSPRGSVGVWEHAGMERPVTRFVGVSSFPGRSVEEVTPYEFLTDHGVRVYLHDTDYLGFERPSATDLTVYFAFDPEWTPRAARETPVVAVAFADVQYRPHPMARMARTQPREDDRPPRFVYSLDWDGMDGFTLDTTETLLAFTSSRMAVSLLPAAPKQLQLRP